MVEVKKHSARHLEIKFVLPFDPKKVIRKDISYYIFTPEELNVNESNISLESMMHKFRTYGRYASPELTLKELIDKDNRVSPLTKLREYVETLVSGEELDVSDVEFTHEAQAVVNSLRHQLKYFQSESFWLIRTKDIDEFKALAKSWKKKRRILEQIFTFMIDDLENTDIENKMFVTALYWADEAISLTSEQYAGELLSLCCTSSELSDVTSILEKIVDHEVRRRRKMGYVDNTDVEKLSYRREVLRRWSRSVLRLDPIVSKAPQRITEAVAIIAASLAMAFSLIATFFAESYFTNRRVRWEFLLIIIYVFKDRIKDGVKRIFSKVQPRLIADKLFIYKTPRTGEKVCSSRNYLSYLDEKKVDKKVRQIRREDSSNPFYKMLSEENIVQFSHYLKIYPLNKNKYASKIPWMSSFALVDHIRMDDWFKELVDKYVDVENANESVNSVYHLHLVIEDKFSKKQSKYYHYLIVIDHTGILNVKEFSKDTIPVIPTVYELSKQLEERRVRNTKKQMKKNKKLKKKKLKEKEKEEKKELENKLKKELENKGKIEEDNKQDNSKEKDETSSKEKDQEKHST